MKKKGVNNYFHKFQYCFSALATLCCPCSYGEMGTVILEKEKSEKFDIAVLTV